MKKMKKLFNRMFVCGLLALLLGACPDAMKPEQEAASAAGTGKVILSLTGTGERTILPLTPVFTKFEFTFETLDGQPGHDKLTINTGGGANAPVELKAGRWNIIAKGFVSISGIEGIANGEYRAAEGRLDNVTVSAGKTMSVSIDLKGGVQAGEKGIFSWDISLPENAVSAVMTIRTIEGIIITIKKNLMVSPSGDMALDSGYYLVTFDLNDQVSRTEILHIYGGMTSSVEKILSTVPSFNSLDDLANWLGNAPDNTADNPYELILYGLNAETDFSQGNDPLGRLYNSLKGKYVNFDMSACKGQAIGDAEYSIADKRPDRDKLVGIKLPAEINTIGSNAFLKCYGLIGVTIQDSVTSIGGAAFYYCYRLTSVTIPDGVTSIGESAFQGCGGLTGIDIPSSVTSIGAGAFRTCYRLTSVTIPNSVTSIGVSAFYGCDGLTAINVDSGNSAYSSQDGVLYDKNKTTLIKYPPKKTETTFTIPNSVTSIENSAFVDSRNLTSVIFTTPSKVTSIGAEAFYRSELTSITIPASVTFIGANAFGSNTGRYPLTEVNVDAGNTAYSSQDGVLYDKNKTTLIEYPPKKTGTTFIIPNSVTSIGTHAFFRCSLKSVTIPNSVTKIGDSAFLDSGLQSITIPSSVTEIQGGFGYGFVSVTFLSANTYFYNNDDTYIGDLRDKYRAGGIGTYTRPSSSVKTWTKQSNTFTSVLTFGTWLDAQRDNTASTPYVVSLNVSSFSENIGIITVNLGKILNNIKNKYVYLDLFGSTITSIPDAAFRDCATLAGIILPNSVTSIGDGAFYGCDALTNITIPNSVTSIGESAFDCCGGLTSVTFTAPSKVTSIGASAFWGCLNLTSIKIPSGVTSIGRAAFALCTSLTSVDIPYGVTSIESGAFGLCYWLTSIYIPSSVTSIGDMAFFGCNGLTSVTFNWTMITSANFSSSDPFPGDLRDKYYATNSANGTPGTYKTANPGYNAVWVKQ